MSVSPDNKRTVAKLRLRKMRKAQKELQSRMAALWDLNQLIDDAAGEVVLLTPEQVELARSCGYEFEQEPQLEVPHVMASPFELKP